MRPFIREKKKAYIAKQILQKKALALGITSEDRILFIQVVGLLLNGSDIVAHLVLA